MLHNSARGGHPLTLTIAAPAHLFLGTLSLPKDALGSVPTPNCESMRQSVLLLLLAAVALGSAHNSDSEAQPTVHRGFERLDLRSLAAQPLPFVPRNASQAWATTSNQSSSLSDARALFQTYSPAADKLLGATAEALMLLQKTGYAFAHEAPVYFADSQDVWFASNAGGKHGQSNLTTNNALFKMHLPHALERAQNGTATFENSVETVYSPLVKGASQFDDVQMTNGATSYGDALLLCNTGRADLPGSLVLVNRSDAQAAPHLLLNNAYGRDFVSLNDVIVHPKGAIL